MRRSVLVAVACLLPGLAHAQETPPSEPLPPLPSEPRAPAEIEATPEPPQPPRPAPEAQKYVLSFKGDVGVTGMFVSGIPATAARVNLGFGVVRKESMHHALVEVVVGRTEADRSLRDFRLGYEGSLRFGIVRLGGGFDAGILSISRVTRPTNQRSLGLGVHAQAGLDLYAWGELDAHAITLDVRMDAFLHASASGVFAPSAALGFRY